MAPLQKSNSVNQADQLQIQHFTHPHMLHKVFMTSEFNCDGCNTGGHGVRYRCSACDFDLHETCATAPHRTTSHLHQQHQLILVNRPGDSHFCNVCRGFTNGLSYTCECQTCDFDVHVLCIEIPVAKGVPSTLDRSQSAAGMSWGRPATAVGGFNGVNNSQPVMINQQQQIQLQHQQQQMQKQGMPMTAFNGYNGMNNTQPMMVNHHQQQQSMPTTAFVGYNGANTNQQMMVNQQMMLNQQPQQPKFYNKMINNQPLMVNQQQQQFGGYPGVNTNQMMMMNQPQQQQGMPMTMYGGYNVVNSNQNMMMNQRKQQQQQQQGTSSNYAKVGKVAANILTTSLIGIPIFNSRR
ncbi:C1-like protein [Tanacetum coccineum]